VRISTNRLVIEAEGLLHQLAVDPSEAVDHDPAVPAWEKQVLS
jgi:hypothetical protein